MTRHSIKTLALLCGGACLGAAVYALVSPTAPSAHAYETRSTVDGPALSADIETIKGKLPSQSHAMQDVGYHFSNLWFAGQQENWDLATFYLAETQSHLRWALRIIPVRKDNSGADVVLAPILEALENGPLKQLQTAIANKNKSDFDAAYRFTMEGCYACHKTSDKPFLRLQIPAQPETPIMNFDPHADWPR